MAGDFDLPAIATLCAAFGFNAAGECGFLLRPEHHRAAGALLRGVGGERSAAVDLRGVGIGEVGIAALPTAADANAPATACAVGMKLRAGERDIGRGEGDFTAFVSCAAGVELAGEVHAFTGGEANCAGVTRRLTSADFHRCSGYLFNTAAGSDGDAAAVADFVSGGAGIPSATVDQVLCTGGNRWRGERAGLHDGLRRFKADDAIDVAQTGSSETA